MLSLCVLHMRRAQQSLCKSCCKPTERRWLSLLLSLYNSELLDNPFNRSKAGKPIDWLIWTLIESHAFYGFKNKFEGASTLWLRVVVKVSHWNACHRDDFWFFLLKGWDVGIVMLVKTDQQCYRWFIRLTCNTSDANNKCVIMLQLQKRATWFPS